MRSERTDTMERDSSFASKNLLLPRCHIGERTTCGPTYPSPVLHVARERCAGGTIYKHRATRTFSTLFSYRNLLSYMYMSVLRSGRSARSHRLDWGIYHYIIALYPTVLHSQIPHYTCHLLFRLHLAIKLAILNSSLALNGLTRDTRIEAYSTARF